MTNATDHDISNMGRCDICGKPIDMRDAGDELATMEFNEPDDDRFSADDIRDAMVRALRGGSPTPADHMLADAIEESGTYVAHQRCVDESSIPDMPTMEDFAEP